MKNKPVLDASIFDLVLCLSEAVDLVSPLVADHHRRTAQVAYGLAIQMHLSDSDTRDLVMAAALHDVGGLTLQDRLGALDFEYNDPYGHAVRGYLLLSSFPPFSHVADMVRFHHVAWKNGEGTQLDGIPILYESHLLQLADRIAILIDPNVEILDQVEGIVTKIKAQSGDRFVPDHVKALEELADKEVFWLDTVYSLSLNTLSRRLNWPQLNVTDSTFFGLSSLFSRIIDFRSPFTATHSAGVAACSLELGKLCGFDPSDCHFLHLAGLLHDLGKLAIPAEILEKPGKLSPQEFDVVRRHTYHTFRIMETLQILDVIRIWGAYHHERMDGYGYPFHLDKSELPLGSRIVSVADIFTALTEKRPYRDGIPTLEALNILKEASTDNRVDSQVVDVLGDHLSDIDEKRISAQLVAIREYQNFVETAEKLTPVLDE